MVPLRSHGFCGVGRGHSGHHWVWYNARGPHLVLRKEPQGSSPFQLASSLQDRPRQGVPRVRRGRRGHRRPEGVSPGGTRHPQPQSGSCHAARAVEPRSRPVRDQTAQSKALPLLHSRPGPGPLVSHMHCPAVAEASSGLSALKGGRSALPAQGPQCLSQQGGSLCPHPRRCSTP